MSHDLIYDIGMHNGDDTAFYLACGFRVLAVEADPDLVAAAHRRFPAEIESQKLIILNVAIADQAGQAEFWINEVRSHLNSFDRTLTARDGEPHHAISVQCRRLDEIISEQGLPFYLKSDIEGHDIVCCRQLSINTKPKYISVEMSQMELLLSLRDLGYDRFKLITQLDLQPIGRQVTKLPVRGIRALYRLSHYRREDRNLAWRIVRKGARMGLQLAGALGLWGESKPFKSRLKPDWNFAPGCSGTFGEDLPGAWLAWEDAADLWRHELGEYQKMGRELWCDLHASNS